MLYEKLTEKEITTIEEYIRRYASPESDRIIAPLDMPHILRIWEAKKGRFLERAFGENLILTRKICISKPEEILMQEMIEALSEECHDIRVKIMGLFDSSCDFYSNWVNLTSASTLAKNQYTSSTFEVVCPNGKTIKVTNGCKPMKMIARIATAFKIDIEDLRLAHSRILNQKELRGELCLSIHPLDFMTMSDNDYGWSSCMSWMNRSDYRMGTVEMMNSPRVVVAYLKGSSDFILGDAFTPISNKKWRTLIVVDSDTITGVKGYPFQNDDLTIEALSWMKELMESANYGPYTEKPALISDSREEWHEELQQYVEVEFDTDRMYNDFGWHHWSYLNKKSEGSIFTNFSGPCECMQCGQDLTDDYAEPHMLICDCCDETKRCYCCGDAHSPEELYTMEDGEEVCENCREENYHTCPVTNKTLHVDHLEQVYVIPNLEKVKNENHILSKAIGKIFINTDVLGTEQGDAFYGPITTIKHPSQYGYGTMTIYAIDFFSATPYTLKKVGMTW